MIVNISTVSKLLFSGYVEKDKVILHGDKNNSGLTRNDNII